LIESIGLSVETMTWKEGSSAMAAELSVRLPWRRTRMKGWASIDPEAGTASF
jgi:hypothetical protein